MPQQPRLKRSFGGVDVHRFSPALGTATPKSINIHMSFEETLKLYFSLGQLLGKLNSYNRSTREGKRSGANVCVYTRKNRITVNESSAIR